MQARDAVESALDLINIPGRGGILQPEDVDKGFKSLRRFVGSESVVRSLTPGVRRHFFRVEESKAVYTYGPDPAADLRSDLFDNDPAPYFIEHARTLLNAQIVDNELVDNPRFEVDDGRWQLSGAKIENNELITDSTLFPSQSDPNVFLRTSALQGLIKLPPVPGVVYRVVIDVLVNHGVLLFNYNSFGVPVSEFPIDATGVHQFDISFSDVTLAGIALTSDTVNGVNQEQDVVVRSVSMVERGKSAIELSQNYRHEYPIKVVGQRTYNRHTSKNIQGRPCHLFYNRSDRISTIELDYAPPVGTVLMLDVHLPVVPERVDQELRLNIEHEEYVIYSLANRLAGQYGKSLDKSQMAILDDARARMTSVNARANNRVVDEGLAGADRGGNNIYNGYYS